LDKTLYEDAERRRRDLEKKRQELEKGSIEQAYHNENSDKYVRKRIMREIQILQQEIRPEDNDNEGEESGNGLLTIVQVRTILIHLGFLPNKQQLDQGEELLVQYLWILVRGQARGGVSWDTLIVLLLNFIGIRTLERELDDLEDDPEEVDQQEGEEDQAYRTRREIQRLAGFREDRFYLRKSSHAKIFSLFKVFYVYRVQFVGLNKKRTQSPQG
jgi:hypothetical protein